MEETLFTPDDLALYLSIPIATIYQWRYRSTGPTSIKVGRHLRYRKSDVESWLVAQEQAS